MKMKKKNLPMGVVNHHAARMEFGVYNEDLRELVKWLKENEITTIAMESTGTYWQNLFSVLQESGFEVDLRSGKFTRNIKGRKTDCRTASGFRSCTG
jgi:transposase